MAPDQCPISACRAGTITASPQRQCGKPCPRKREMQQKRKTREPPQPPPTFKSELGHHVFLWASKLLVFGVAQSPGTNVSEIRAAFAAADGGLAKDLNANYFFEGVAAAAKMQGLEEGKVRDRQRDGSRTYRCRWVTAEAAAAGVAAAAASAAATTAAAAVAEPKKHAEVAVHTDRQQRRRLEGSSNGTVGASRADAAAAAAARATANSAGASATPGTRFDGDASLYSTLCAQTKDQVAPDPATLVGRVIRRFFPGHGWYDGKIKRVISRGKEGRHKTFDVRYADGDNEHLSLSQLRAILSAAKSEKPAAAASEEVPATKLIKLTKLGGVSGTSSASNLIGRDVRLWAGGPQACSRDSARRSVAGVVTAVQPPEPGDDEQYFVELVHGGSTDSTSLGKSSAGGSVLTLWELRESLQPSSKGLAAMWKAQGASCTVPLLKLQQEQVGLRSASLQRQLPHDTSLAALLDMAVEVCCGSIGVRAACAEPTVQERTRV